MKILPIESSSKGNCFYLESEYGKFIFEAGVAIENVKRRLLEIDVKMTDIDYILITHTHLDHFKHIESYMKGFKNARLIIHKEHYKNFLHFFNNIDSDRIVNFSHNVKTYGQIKIGGFNIAYSIIDHDEQSGICINYFLELEDTVAFIIDSHDLNVVSKAFLKNTDIVFIESNHDVKKLENSSYHEFLKDRIKVSHLNNEQCLNLFKDNTKTKTLIVTHISHEANMNPSDLEALFKKELKNTNIRNLYAVRKINKLMEV